MLVELRTALSFALLLAGLASSATCQCAGTQVQTFTYKTVGDLGIKLDVHRSDDNKKRPVAVWIHGGALIMGGRQQVNRGVQRAFIESGYALVSIDYRLAPETRLPEIIEDLEDAFKWIRQEGPAQFNADVSKIAVIGGSAGGYLTLTAGFRVEPPPTVLVSLWGYGDLIGPWYSTPSPHARHHQATLSEAEVERMMQAPSVANDQDRRGNGAAFYMYCRQHGWWPKLVSGFDPRDEPEKYHPFMPVRNVTKGYPPTLLIHGTEDTDVPYEQSVMMAQQFEKCGVPYELMSIEGGEHGLAGGSPERIEEAYEAILPFVNKYIRP